MQITALYGHRKEDFDGQYRPELFSSVDDLTLEENPEWWTSEVAKHKAEQGDDITAWAEVTFEVKEADIMAALYPSATITATLVR